MLELCCFNIMVLCYWNDENIGNIGTLFLLEFIYGIGEKNVNLSQSQCEERVKDCCFQEITEMLWEQQNIWQLLMRKHCGSLGLPNTKSKSEPLQDLNV